LGHLARHGTWDHNPKDGGAAPWLILDVTLFRQFLLTPNEFGSETNAIGSYLKLSFHPYKECPKQTLYAIWASFFVRAAPGLRGGLELELFLGLHLGDMNRISFGPSSRLGKPYWSPSSSCHSPCLALCLLVMSSLLS
jgi:hypothetical protein